MTIDNWRYFVKQPLLSANWKIAVQDALPLLEPGANASLMTLENLSSLLDK